MRLPDGAYPAPGESLGEESKAILRDLSGRIRRLGAAGGDVRDQAPFAASVAASPLGGSATPKIGPGEAFSPRQPNGRGTRFTAPDRDGRGNFDEYTDGTDPTDPNSRFRVTGFDGSSIAWLAREFTLYELQQSSDLVSRERVHDILPRTSAGLVAIPSTGVAAAGFFRIVRIR